MTVKTLILAPETAPENAHRILEKYGFHDPEQAYRNLLNIAGTPTVRREFAEIAERLLVAVAASPDADAALNNFDRFMSVTFSRMWVCHLLRDAPFLIRVLANCFGSSTYLSDILVRNPEYFNEIIDASVMETPKDCETMYNELSRSVGLFRSVEQKLNALRRYKRKESLRIGLRDFFNDADLEQTTLELTYLAEASLQICCEIGTAELAPKFGTPLATDGETPSTFAVIAMGKFGGYELNFSSDIDVMFIYSHEGKTDTGVENHEYFSKLCEFIIRAMSEITSGGYVFRVDVRLRPESSVGVLVRSIDSYEAYYEGWGEIWERQALIKARPVAGDPRLGERFIDTIQPFVYQRYLDGFSLDEIKVDIRQTKARIERRIVNEKGDPKTHVKQGIGSIRDVEFTVQCLQLIHGGPRPTLRNHNSLETIELLYQHDLLSQSDRDILAEGYRFLRKVEHRIQMEADQQRYVLPARESDRIKLAKSTGYQDTEAASALAAFEADYARHTAAVREIFEKVLETPVPEGGIDVVLLLSTTDSQVIGDILAPVGFANPRDAHRQLKLMADGPEGVRFSANVRRLFAAMAPTLLNFLRESPDPDMALRYIEDFTGKVGARASYYALFRDNPPLLELLTRLCGTSLFLADVLVANPESFDILTVPAAMEHPKTLAAKLREADHAIADATNDDEVFHALRRFKNSEVLRIGMRNIMERADLWTTTAELSDLAEATLQTMCIYLNKRLQAERGKPVAENGTVATFSVIGMGKFGGRELNFSSDLDVLFVYSAEGRTTADYFNRLGLELVNRMKGIYELDLRLRPYGTGGAIALSLAGYENYYNGDYAETWERQALIRARPVAGELALGGRFLETAHAFAYRQPLTVEQVAEIVHNRQRKEAQATRPTTTRHRRRGGIRKTQDVKSGYGGLVDIEFAVQTLQLLHGTDHLNLRVRNTIEAINQLCEVDVLTAEHGVQLSNAYQFLRRVENSLRIVHDRPLHALPDKTAELEKLAKRLGYADAETFLKDYQACTERTRGLFNLLLKG